MKALLRFSALVLLSASLCSGSAWAWFGPSAADPYSLVVPPIVNDQQLSPVWFWVDARPTVELENQPTRDGYHFGDAVLSPRPFDYIKAEFVRQVALHEERAALLEKLNGKTIRLIEFDASVGLRIRLGEMQSNKWEAVRIRAVIEVDGNRYEASDTHPFRNGDKPSPVSIPMRAVVETLVNQRDLQNQKRQSYPVDLALKF
jgi:hypothetical protein